MSLRLTWSIQRVPGQPALHSETLSQKILHVYVDIDIYVDVDI